MKINSSQIAGFGMLYIALLLLVVEVFLIITKHWIFVLLILPCIFLVYFTIKYLIFED